MDARAALMSVGAVRLVGKVSRQQQDPAARAPPEPARGASTDDGERCSGSPSFLALLAGCDDRDD